jgi:ABC-2 type transport system ATP-binding protein
MSSAAAISVKNLSKHFGKLRAVDDISFEVPKGQIVGFVGPNGAGKTTTISMLMGFIRATKGKAEINGRKVQPESSHLTHRNIGYVAGDMALFDNLTGEQYLAFLAHQYGMGKRQKELIKRLQPRLGEQLKKLSRGNKQKVALIGALQHEPSITILDEPTSGLDPLMQETFLAIIREERDRGATIFMSSHILSEVATSCDRVMFMKRGKIVTDKPVKDLEESQGKLITIVTDHRDVEQMTHHPLQGATILKQTGNKIQMRYEGDIRLLVSWLNDRPILDISITERNLDDIFHDLYKEDDEG